MRLHASTIVDATYINEEACVQALTRVNVASYMSCRGDNIRCSDDDHTTALCAYGDPLNGIRPYVVLHRLIVQIAILPSWIAKSSLLQ